MFVPSNPPGVALFFHFLHHPLFPFRVSPCPHPHQTRVKLCLFGWCKAFQRKMSSTMELYGVHERKSMWIRHWAGNLPFGFCTDPLSDSRPALFKLFSPRQIHTDDKPALCGEWGSRAHPHRGADLCRLRRSSRDELAVTHRRLRSPSSQPGPGSSGSSFRASSDIHSPAAVCSVNRSLIPLQA